MHVHSLFLTHSQRNIHSYVHTCMHALHTCTLTSMYAHSQACMHMRPHTHTSTHCIALHCIASHHISTHHIASHTLHLHMHGCIHSPTSHTHMHTHTHTSHKLTCMHSPTHHTHTESLYLFLPVGTEVKF